MYAKASAKLSRRYRIGEIIDRREDGTIVYMSSLGVVNLDSRRELADQVAEDESFLGRKLNVKI